MEQMHRDSKLICLFQPRLMLSHTQKPHHQHAERNCHSLTPEYTHNAGCENIIEGCADISLELTLCFILYSIMFYSSIHPSIQKCFAIITSRRCEVVLAVAKLTTRLLGCSGWLLGGCLGILGGCYGVAMRLLEYSG